ncbi:MAG: ACP S-malonyltransferase [Synergistaceae bacterium]|jgi:[acyl-carrier-protein] S-malonyltransferase|nr:ACP S-malonyltransferase [Synergistaceae bacterium]
MSDSDYAIVFPGQGAQEVGMGCDFRDAYTASRDVFDEADEALGFRLSKIIFEGPEDELTKTAFTQPAILVTSVAVLRAIEHELGREPCPRFYAGHSLGEYTALVADGVLSLGDAARLVHKRGALMQDAVPLGEGAMAAVMGLDMAAASEVCALAAGDEVCGVANVNSPGQIVISGSAGAVVRAGELAKERGASRVIPLKVSAPFHCALMRPVADKLMEAFDSCAWREPKVPIMANVDAGAKASADAIRAALYEQTYKPVLWADGVLSMADAGTRRFAEFGPGNVLSGLIKRTVKGIPTLSVNKAADVMKAIDFLSGADQ